MSRAFALTGAAAARTHARPGAQLDRAEQSGRPRAGYVSIQSGVEGSIFPAQPVVFGMKVLEPIAQLKITTDAE